MTGDNRPFSNEPNTDWVLTRNREWIAEIRERWRTQGPPEGEIPLVLGEHTVRRSLDGIGRDSSKPGEVAYRYELATADDVDRALVLATQSVPTWWSLGVDCAFAKFCVEPRR